MGNSPYGNGSSLARQASFGHRRVGQAEDLNGRLIRLVVPALVQGTAVAIAARIGRHDG